MKDENLGRAGLMVIVVVYATLCITLNHVVKQFLC